jgi:hypothetical protein
MHKSGRCVETQLATSLQECNRISHGSIRLSCIFAFA